MAYPAYRYLLCDLLTDRLLASVPLSGVSFDRRLCRTGSLQGTMTATDQRTAELARLMFEYAGRSALWVFRDESLWWGGIPWTVVPTQDTRGGIGVSVTAATFDSYAHHRYLPADVTYAQADQGAIIPDLWRRIQADPRGNIGMLADDQPTGVLRDRTYLESDMPYVGQLIEDLGDVDDGPEHTVDVYLDANGTRTKRLRVGNTLGVQSATMVFQRAVTAGGRIASWQHAADATDGGTVFRARGATPDGNAGESVQPLMSDTVERADLLGAGWPLLDVSTDHTDVTELATLNNYAAALAQTNGGAMSTSGYTVQVGTTGWSPNRLGDTVRLRIDDLWHDNVDLTARPVGCKVTAAEKGQPETVELLLSEDD